ncbi:MAG: hypothetical protein HGA85_02205 [Nanoarchaeota archaeon]|nr:hypothetical protein [Nanoarchaeota archaeon]
MVVLIVSLIRKALDHPPIEAAYIAGILKAAKKSYDVLDLNLEQYISSRIKNLDPQAHGMGGYYSAGFIHEMSIAINHLAPDYVIYVADKTGLDSLTILLEKVSCDAFSIMALDEAEKFRSLFSKSAEYILTDYLEFAANPVIGLGSACEAVPSFDKFKLYDYTCRILPIKVDSRSSSDLRYSTHLIALIKTYIQLYGVREYVIRDFPAGSEELLCSFSAGICSKRIKISWVARAEISAGLTLGLLSKLVMSGCHMLHFPIPTLSDRLILQANLPYSSELALKVIRDAKNAGLTTGVILKTGLQGERSEDIIETVRKLSENSLYVDDIVAVEPMPGADAGHEAKKNRILGMCEKSNIYICCR